MWPTVLLIMTKFQDVSLIAKRSNIKYSRTYKTPKIELADIQGAPQKRDFQNARHFLMTGQNHYFFNIHALAIMGWPSAD